MITVQRPTREISPGQGGRLPPFKLENIGGALQLTNSPSDAEVFQIKMLAAILETHIQARQRTDTLVLALLRALEKKGVLNLAADFSPLLDQAEQDAQNMNSELRSLANEVTKWLQLHDQG
jgi:hypothetical protein